jgi:hypothetical protein
VIRLLAFPRAMMSLARKTLAAVMRPRRWLHDLSHHLVVAVAVASIVGLLHHGGGLEWLDSLMLRIAGAFVWSDPPKLQPNAKSPEILLIGGALYEQAFEQRSPLDRGKLAALVKAVRDHSGGLPATVVIDLDVSDNVGDVTGQTALDDELERLVQGGVLVVLPMPLPVITPLFVDAKVKWMRKACSWRPAQPEADGRIIFASPALRSNAGRVLQYSDQDLSLGIAATRPSRFDDICVRSIPEQQLLVHTATAAQLGQLSATSPRLAKTRPLNATFFLSLPQHVHEIETTAKLPLRDDGQPLALAGRAVFIGGSYDLRDRFDTAVESDGQPTEGVTLHAGVFYSASDPVSVEQGFGALGIDIVIGILMGYGFTAAWQRHDAAQAAPGWKGYVVPKVLYVVILLIGFGLAALLVWIAAGVLFPLNLWVSPGPVVLGVCAKLMLSRRANAHAEPHVMPPHASRWVTRAVIGCLAVANVVMIISHG